MSVDDEGPTAGMSRRSAGGLAVAELVQQGRVHPRAVVVLHRRIAATLDAVGPRRFAVDRSAVTGVGTQALSLLCGTSRRLGCLSATVSIAGGDLGIHRGLEAHRIDRVVIQSSGQANRPQRAPVSGRIA